MQDTKALFSNPINTELNIRFLNGSQMGNDVKAWIYNNLSILLVNRVNDQFSKKNLKFSEITHGSSIFRV